MSKSHHQTMTSWLRHYSFSAAVRPVVCGLAVLMAASMAVAQTYTVEDLGTFDGGKESYGQAVNFFGQVAGYAYFNRNFAHGAFWSIGSSPQDLGAIPPQNDFSFALAINRSGEMAGYSTQGYAQLEHAVRWTKGSLEDLGTLPGGNLSQAMAINDLGEIAGFSNSGIAQPHAFLWTEEKGMQSLGTLPGGYYSQGLGINGQGEVTGYSNNGQGQTLAFLWSKSGGMQALPNPPGATGGSGNAVNDLGHVAGGSDVTATLWTSTQDVLSLGNLPGACCSSGFALNDLDQVVGSSGFRAFIWTQADGMQDLNNLIPPHSGWTLTAANGINFEGQITGYGTINGQTHAFLLTPTSN